MAGDIITRHGFDDSAYLAGLNRDVQAARRAQAQIRMEQERMADAIFAQAVREENAEQQRFNREVQAFGMKENRKQATATDAAKDFAKKQFDMEKAARAAMVGIGAAVKIGFDLMMEFARAHDFTRDRALLLERAWGGLRSNLGAWLEDGISGLTSMVHLLDRGAGAIQNWLAGAIQLGKYAFTGQVDGTTEQLDAMKKAQMEQEKQGKQRQSYREQELAFQAEIETARGFDIEAAKTREMLRRDEDRQRINELASKGTIDSMQQQLLLSDAKEASQARIAALEKAASEKAIADAKKISDEEAQRNREQMQKEADRSQRQVDALRDLDMARKSRDIEIDVAKSRQAEAREQDPSKRSALQDENNRRIAIARETLEFERQLAEIQNSEAISEQYKAQAADDLRRQHEQMLEIIKNEQAETEKTQLRKAETEKTQLRSRGISVGFGVGSVAAATFGSSSVAARPIEREQAGSLKKIVTVLERIANRSGPMTAVYG